MDIKDMEASFEKDVQNSEEISPYDVINELKQEIYEFKKTLEMYGILEKEYVDDLEYICITQLKQLRDIADSGILTPDDIKVLDSCSKTILKLRGKEEKKDAPGKKASIGELLSIVGDE